MRPIDQEFAYDSVVRLLKVKEYDKKATRYHHASFNNMPCDMVCKVHATLLRSATLAVSQYTLLFWGNRCTQFRVYALAM